jgi:hypothetical protein
MKTRKWRGVESGRAAAATREARAPRGWRYDGVLEPEEGETIDPNEGVGCPWYEMVRYGHKPGDLLGMFETAGDGGIVYTGKYKKACTLVLWGHMDTGELPGACEKCKSRPAGRAAWLRDGEKRWGPGHIMTHDDPPEKKKCGKSARRAKCRQTRPGAKARARRCGSPRG